MRSVFNSLVNLLSAATLYSAIAAGSAHAMPNRMDDLSQGKLAVLDAPTSPCPLRGGLCLTAGEYTLNTTAPLYASAIGAPLPIVETPSFRRLFQLGRDFQLDTEAAAWNLDVSAWFRKQAWAGNALFILTDLDDPEQVQTKHTVTALYQTAIPAGERTALRMVLSPEDGFHAGHTYRLRVVQLIAGTEVELAAGNIQLL